jgi:membrane fusion protein, multidrug efflux system
METKRILVEDLADCGEVEHPRPAMMSNRMRQTMIGFGAVALFVATLFGGYRGWNYLRTWVTTDNAYLSGHVHLVSARLAGTITEVLVDENQAVREGAVVARLDVRDLEVQREKAAAELAQAEAQIAQAGAQVLQNTALESKAQQDFDRADNLFHSQNSVISKQEFDAAKTALEAAHASLSASHAMVRAAEAQRSSAIAQLKEVKLQLSYTEIRAPATGRIGRKSLEVGNRVQAGQALLAIVEAEVWVTANFKETQLERLRPGQKVNLKVDSFPSHTFTGRLESLAPASGAQFALLPPDNATGNFTRIVQRVPVKIVFEPDCAREFEGRLVPGMSAKAKVLVLD